MLIIDGSMGEGGGQVVRSSLALSLVTGTPFRIEKVRAGRKQPGLMRQHLTAVRAAATIGGARVVGAEIGAQAFSFEPGEVKGGEYRFAVGTAGSTTLVMQTVLPALLVGKGPSKLSFEGGTHNPMAPPFDFIEHAFLPLISRMGAKCAATLDRPGFYPAGGGRFCVEVQSAAEELVPFALLTRGEVREREARALVAHLPRSIAEREVRKVRDLLNWPEDEVRIDMDKSSIGPGNCILVRVGSEYVTEVFSSIGQKGLKAENVAKAAADEVKRYMASDVPVGLHLADQLLIPLAMAGAGRFRTLAPTRHTWTNAEVVKTFLPHVRIDITQEEEGGRTWSVRVHTP